MLGLLQPFFFFRFRLFFFLSGSSSSSPFLSYFYVIDVTSALPHFSHCGVPHSISPSLPHTPPPFYRVSFVPLCPPFVHFFITFCFNTSRSSFCHLHSFLVSPSPRESKEKERRDVLRRGGQQPSPPRSRSQLSVPPFASVPFPIFCFSSHPFSPHSHIAQSPFPSVRRSIDTAHSSTSALSRRCSLDGSPEYGT